MLDSTPRRLKGRSYAETRSAVLDLIRSSGSISRVEIVEGSGLTAATITKIVRELLSKGIVVEAGSAESTGGKRATLLSLNPGVLYAVGLTLDYSEIVVVLCGLNGSLLDRIDIPGMGIDAPGTVMDRVAHAIDTLLIRNAISTKAVVGIGVASTGRRRGPLGWNSDPGLLSGWEDFDAAAELERRVGSVVFTENDANCVALGTFWSGTSPTRDFITVYMAYGVGAGIIVDGAVYRGASDNAGEIGHVIVEANGRSCWCGANGCLETVATPRAMAQRVRRDPHLRTLFGVEEEYPASPDKDLESEFAFYPRVAAVNERIREAFLAGVPEAVDLIDRSAERLALVLVGLINTLDLDRVELAGPGFAVVGHRYVERLREFIDKGVFSRAVHNVDVELGGVGPEVASLGAASVVLHSSLTPHRLGPPPLARAFTRVSPRLARGPGRGATPLPDSRTPVGRDAQGS